ncbi:MAG: TonB-dependent receptor, partial [Bacteroidales bacterium]|nr:TonB-dependent receptor [Bacteroidales bacterium]
DIIKMANNEQTPENLRTYGLGGRSVIAPNFSKALNEQNEDQYEAHVDLTIPFHITNAILIDLKIGGQYKYKDRKRDYDLVVWHSNVFQDFITGETTTGDGINWTEGLEWVTLNDNSAVSMENMVGGSIDDFLGGSYIFGWYPDVDKINQMYDYWVPMVEYYRAQGKEVWEPLFGFEIAMGNILPRPSVAHDYSYTQNYYAGYVMPTISIGNKITLVPGFRYEKVDADMKSWYVERRVNETMEIPGYETSAERENNYFLPMIHFKYKALRNLQFQGSYTQTLNRPLFNTVVPYVYVNNASKPFQHESGNPQLKPELWTNYDINVALHSSKVGLVSINGFYKRVEDKIWNRKWTRLTEDEPIPPFTDLDEVDVTGWYNHEHEVTVMGFEAEWQTNFWYLPKPFSYFTLSLNYSYINNKTKYPWEEVNMVSVDTTDAGRVIYNKIRVDSAFAGPMINQPSHLANASLGFSYKGFDSWISFQYISDIPISLSGAVEKHVYKIAFVRWDFQSRLTLPVKGLELMFSISNINNIQEEQYMKGDSRPIHVERYGWTSNFGIRYTF